MRISALLAALFCMFAVAAPARATPTPDGLCDVTVTVPAQWSNGYSVAVTVRNISIRPVTWRASVAVPPPGYIVQGWNATFQYVGSTVWIYPPPYPSGVLQPGQSHNFGYLGSGTMPALPVVTCS
ncbi:hypothetical protein Prum_027180 [Phytohabitans rumicis]|uniref:CBM2 domain-containing protein n=2 Tax=Phytohabitans rumicis TaxID=1076125 RepID=A0A6V8L4K6_9ACTN|nr:hypothetical protein Prum_027180 [Phytohabitans rumicis]